MAGLLKEGERILKKISEIGIKQLEYYYALDLELYRPKQDEYTDVFGVHSGNQEYLVKQFEGVVVSDDMFGTDAGYSGNFEEGFLYTSDKEARVGDIIRILSDDKKVRRFKIIEFEAIGTQTEIVSRYKLSNLSY
jgi:hypothetical protein